MGLLVDGAWRDVDMRVQDNGRFVRKPTAFHNYVTADGSPGPTGKGGFPAEAGRYHLYVSLACPWAHRTLIFRKLKKLEDVISVSVTVALLGKKGWEFGTEPGATGDTVNGKSTLADIYVLSDPQYSGRVSVPVLWDKKQRVIVNNESSEIIRMLNSAFDAFTDVRTDFYPAELRSEIDRINGLVMRPSTTASIAPVLRSRKPPMRRRRGRCSRRSIRSNSGYRGSVISRAGSSPRRIGGCSPHWCGSMRSITATSNATCGASSIIRTSGIICASFIKSRAWPRPSASIISSGTITAAIAT